MQINLALWQNLCVCQSSDIIRFCHCQIFAAHQQEHLFFFKRQVRTLLLIVSNAGTGDVVAVACPAVRWPSIHNGEGFILRDWSPSGLRIGTYITTHDFGYPCYCSDLYLTWYWTLIMGHGFVTVYTTWSSVFQSLLYRSSSCPATDTWQGGDIVVKGGSCELHQHSPIIP